MNSRVAAVNNTLPPAWPAALLIVLAGFLAYSDSFQGAFVFDDVQSIPENRDIRSLSPLSRVLTSQRTATVIGRPLLSLSLAVSYALHRADVRGYHFFSLLVHLLTALTLFGVLRRTFLLPLLAPRWQRGATLRAAIITLLWVVHPLASSAVLYIVQRAELLAGLAYLLTIYAFLRSVASERSGLWQLIAVVCCAAGMAVKETVATVPLAVLLIDRLLVASSWRELWQRRWKLYLGLAATWLELAALVAFSQGRKGSAGFGAEMTSWHYLLTQSDALVKYLSLSVWPQPLVFDYGFDVAHSLIEVWWQAVVIATLLAITFLLAWRRPQVALLPLLFFLILGPTSSVVPLITHTIAEHRMYLPLAIVLTILILAAESFFTRNPARSPGRAAQQVGLIAIGALAVTWSVWTHNRAADYVTPLTLWQDTLRKRPQNARAHNNVGAEYANQGDLTRARREFEQSITLRPDYADPHGNLGNLFLREQQFARALQEFDEAIRLNSGSPHHYLLRADVRGRMGDFTGALADATRGIELAPEEPSPYQQRAIARIALKEYDLARADLETVERLGGQPDPRLLRQLPPTSAPAPAP